MVGGWLGFFLRTNRVWVRIYRMFWFNVSLMKTTASIKYRLFYKMVWSIHLFQQQHIITEKWAREIYKKNNEKTFGPGFVWQSADKVGFLCLLQFFLHHLFFNLCMHISNDERFNLFVCVCVCLPAALASLHASYMSCLISGLSSAMISPTHTNRSTAKLTAWPTRPMARNERSVVTLGRSDRCWTSVDICNNNKMETMKKIVCK
jgi:hypothetical protein